MWTDFFKSLETRCHPFDTIKNLDYHIYQLQPENVELIRLLSTDEKLKECVIRAEGYLILVKNENYAKFTKRMKALGYML